MQVATIRVDTSGLSLRRETENVRTHTLLWNSYAVFRREQDVAILDPASLEVVYLSDEEFSVVRDRPNSGAAKSTMKVLASAGIYPGTQMDWIGGLKATLKAQGQGGKASSVSGARIVLTDKCNMTCSYCFVDTNTGQADMSVEELREGLDQIFKAASGRQTFLLQWFGGEPTLRFDLMKEGDSYARKLAKRYGIKRLLHTVVTNGYRIKPEMIDHFQRFRYGVGISVDGFQGVNRRSRTLLSGRDVDEKIETNIRLLTRIRGISTGINITPNSENINDLEASSLYAMDALGVKFLYFNTPIPGPTGWQIDGVRLANALVAIRRHAISRGCMALSSVERSFQAMDTRRPKVYEYIQADGSLSVALLPNRRISLMDINWKSSETVFDYRSKDLTDMLPTLQKNVAKHRECQSCFAVGACGGPSVNDSLSAGGEMSQPDPEYCNYTRSAFVLALWDSTGLQ